MDDATSGMRNRSGSCPHVDDNDPRCATRFSLGRIEQAFSVCFGAFHGCPMFHRINGESSPIARRRPEVMVALTVSRHATDLPLRATGT